MSTLTWTGNAHAVKQITTLTVSGTWAGSDTYTLTINGKDLTITIGNGTTTAQVAASIAAAFNATSRLDGTQDAANTNTSNFGGQEFGEFTELTAVIYTASASVVRLIGTVAGRPVTVTGSGSSGTAGDGDVTIATAQAATGPNHWNNADNWDTGSVPVDDDVVVFRDSDIPCKYGLPDSTDLEVTIYVYMSYTGQVGLPRINRDNAAKPYLEYRQRYVRLDDGGTGTDIAHRFGLGKDGSGCTLFNLKHITVKCSPIVYNTGAPQVPGTKALNIVCTANTSTINILKGSVDFGSQDGGTSAFVTFSQSGGDSIAINGIHTAGAAVTVSGGTSVIGGSGAIATINCKDSGDIRIEDQTGTITSLLVHGGIVRYLSTGTISGFTLTGGTFDASEGAPFTMTVTNIFHGGKFYDPLRRITFTNDVNYFGNPSQELQIGGNFATSFVFNYS